MKTSASSLAQICRSLPGIPSGPVALFSLMLDRSFWTPALDTIILGIGFFGVCLTCSVEDGLGDENTLVKKVLNMLVLVTGFWIRVSPDFRSAIPVLSLFLLLM